MSWSDLFASVRWVVKVNGEIRRGVIGIVGKGVELVGEGAGSLVGMVHERSGEAVKEGFKTAARAVEYPENLATRLEEGVVDFLTGDTDSAENACEAIGNDVKEVIEQVDRTWDEVTARRLFDQAKSKYENLQKKQNYQQRRVTREINTHNTSARLHLDRINKCRTQADELFRRFEILTEAFADYRCQVKNPVFVEHFKPKKYRFDKMPKCGDIFADVNFDDDPIWTNLKGIFTFGFWNEAKIKEAESKLDNIEKYVLPEAVAKGDAEVARSKAIADALEPVKTTFVFCIELYQKLLQELEYSVHLLRCAEYVRNCGAAHDPAQKVSMYFLPEHHRECLMACDRLSRLLCEMAKRKYFDDSNVTVIDPDIKYVRENYDAVIIPIQQKFTA